MQLVLVIALVMETLIMKLSMLHNETMWTVVFGYMMMSGRQIRMRTMFPSFTLAWKEVLRSTVTTSARTIKVRQAMENLDHLKSHFQVPFSLAQS